MLIMGIQFFAPKSTQRYPFCPFTPEKQIQEVSIMKDEQKRQIIALRRDGVGEQRVFDEILYN